MSYSIFRSLPSHFLIPTLAIAIFAFVGGCSSADEGGLTGPNAPPQSLTFETVEQSEADLETIDRGEFGNTEEDTVRVIRDQSTFKSFWNSLHGDDAEVPDVDFSAKIVLAAVLGERPTGGYEADIESISKNTNPPEVRVFVNEIEPGSGCPVTQAITVPYHIVKTDKFSANRVTFADDGTETKECE